MIEVQLYELDLSNGMPTGIGGATQIARFVGEVVAMSCDLVTSIELGAGIDAISGIFLAVSSPLALLGGLPVLCADSRLPTGTDMRSRDKRIDEAASANEQTKLERQQQVAIIGETIPLIFCKRTEWGCKGWCGGAAKADRFGSGK